MRLAVNIGRSFLGNQQAANNQTLGGIISVGLRLAFTVAGILVLFFIVIAGFKMIQSAGKNNPQDAEKARSAMTSAAIGFVVIFVAYWIVRLIEAITGVKFITDPSNLPTL